MQRKIDPLEQTYGLQNKFFSNISHEIRTQLTAILGFTELLQEDTLSQEQRHMVGVISSSSSILPDLVNDMLDFTKLILVSFNYLKNHKPSRAYVPSH